MIPFHEAQQIVMSHVRLLPAETTGLADSLNRVLATDIHSDIDMPPFNKSSMDGYACRMADITSDMTIIETIAAGTQPRRKIEPGQCAKIMTGAMVPEGADCVIMVEYTEITPENKVRFNNKTTDVNIARRGLDVKTNDTVLLKGTLIKPEHIAILAMTGIYRPEVVKRPRVGILTTGSELVEPDMKPEGPQIRNSNGWQLSAQAVSMGCDTRYYGVAEDKLDIIQKKISLALDENDVIVISGGVSMGEYDLVPEALERNGVKILFDQVAVQPGKPATFGVSHNAAVFALPGNPVAAFVTFSLFAKPFLYALMGHEYKPDIWQCTLGIKLTRNRTERLSFVPVRKDIDGRVFPVEYNGSSNISALRYSQGLIAFPVGISELDKGSLVDVRLL